MLKILYEKPLITNAHCNRKACMKAYSAGMTLAQIAAEWPEVWELDSDGKIGQKYDSIFYGTDLKETKYRITDSSVKTAIKRHKAKP